jgi:hypothetical protein
MVMTDVQLYFAVGLPVFAFLLNIALGVIQTNTLQARITSVETGVNSRLSDFESTMNSRFAGVDARFSSLESNIERALFEPGERFRNADREGSRRRQPPDPRRRTTPPLFLGPRDAIIRIYSA